MLRLIGIETPARQVVDVKPVIAGDLEVLECADEEMLLDLERRIRTLHRWRAQRLQPEWIRRHPHVEHGDARRRELERRWIAHAGVSAMAEELHVAEAAARLAGIRSRQRVMTDLPHAAPFALERSTVEFVLRQRALDAFLGPVTRAGHAERFSPRRVDREGRCKKQS